MKKIKNYFSTFFTFVALLSILIPALSLPVFADLQASLQIEAPAVVDEENQGGSNLTVSSGGGSPSLPPNFGKYVILEPKTPEQNRQPQTPPTEADSADPNTPQTPTQPEQATPTKPQAVDQKDEKSGIEIIVPKKNQGLKFIIPLPEIIETPAQVVIPPPQPVAAKIERQITGQQPLLQGKTQYPNSYILLEINKGQKVIPIRSDDEGNWQYTPAELLKKGDYNIFVWEFPKDTNLAPRLSNSIGFRVKEESKSNNARTESDLSETVISLLDSKITLDQKSSAIAANLLKGDAINKVFNFNGRILNQDKDLNPESDKLEFVVALSPIFKDFNFDTKPLQFRYLIYNRDGKLVQSIADKELHFFDGEILAFTKSFELLQDKLLPGTYTMVIQTDVNDLTYEFPLEFSVSTEPKSLVSKAKNSLENNKDDIMQTTFTLLALGGFIFVLKFFLRK